MGGILLLHNTSHRSCLYCKEHTQQGI